MVGFELPSAMAGERPARPDRKFRQQRPPVG